MADELAPESSLPQSLIDEIKAATAEPGDEDATPASPAESAADGSSAESDSSPSAAPASEGESGDASAADAGSWHDSDDVRSVARALGLTDEQVRSAKDPTDFWKRVAFTHFNRERAAARRREQEASQPKVEPEQKSVQAEIDALQKLLDDNDLDPAVRDGLRVLKQQVDQFAEKFSGFEQYQQQVQAAQQRYQQEQLLETLSTQMDSLVEKSGLEFLGTDPNALTAEHMKARNELFDACLMAMQYERTPVLTESAFRRAQAMAFPDRFANLTRTQAIEQARNQAQNRLGAGSSVGIKATPEYDDDGVNMKAIQAEFDRLTRSPAA
jgi:hypothetical protein